MWYKYLAQNEVVEEIMPKVVQEAPRGNSAPAVVKRTGGVLDRAIPVARHDSGGLKVCLYGRNGTGKTTLACKFPKPLLLLGFEDGTKSVRNVQGVTFLRVWSSREYDKLTDKSNAMSVTELEQLTQEIPRSGYKTVVLDTVTALENTLLAEVTQQERAPVQSRFGKYPREVYFARAEKLKERLRDFFDLSDRTGLNLVVVAQERDHSKKGDKEDEGSKSEWDDLMVPYVGASLGDSAAKFVHEGCDYVLQCYTDEETKEVEDDVAGEKVKSIERTGKMVFCLRTMRTHPVYAAKFRTDERSPVPDVIVKPTWEKLSAFMK